MESVSWHAISLSEKISVRYERSEMIRYHIISLWYSWIITISSHVSVSMMDEHVFHSTKNRKNMNSDWYFDKMNVVSYPYRLCMSGALRSEDNVRDVSVINLDVYCGWIHFQCVFEGEFLIEVFMKISMYWRCLAFQLDFAFSVIPDDLTTLLPIPPVSNKTK